MEFDTARARRLAAICRAVYVGTEDQLPSEIEGGRVEGIQAGGAGGRTSLAVVVDGPGADLVVAFRGTLVTPITEDVHLVALDWIENLRAGLVDVDFGSLPGLTGAGGAAPRVHQGFQEEFGAVRDALLERIGGRSAGRRLYVTGHSQGAAVAALATLVLSQARHEVAAAYLFAAPRPGDGVFRQAVEATAPVFRVEVGNDLVPHVPPARALARMDAHPVTRWIADRLRAMASNFRAGPLRHPVIWWFVRRIPSRLRPHAEACFRLMQTSVEAYESVGDLWYADATDRRVRHVVRGNEEDSLLLERNAALLRNPKDLFGDHWIGHYEHAVS